MIRGNHSVLNKYLWLEEAYEILPWGSDENRPAGFESNNTVTVRCQLNGTICNTLIDSGASCCIIDKSSFQNLRAGMIRKTSKTFVDASGNNMKIIGYVRNSSGGVERKKTSKIFRRYR